MQMLSTTIADPQLFGGIGQLEPASTVPAGQLPVELRQKPALHVKPLGHSGPLVAHWNWQSAIAGV
jgi:hypothetical protein